MNGESKYEAFERKHCLDCKHFDNCYLIAGGSDLYPKSIPEYFNAMRKRDLCVNNKKDGFDLRKDYREDSNF